MGSAELPVEEAIGAAVTAKELDIRNYSSVTEALKTFFCVETTFVGFAVNGLGSRQCQYLLHFDLIKKLQNCFSDLISLAFSELWIHWQ